MSDEVEAIREALDNSDIDMLENVLLLIMKNLNFLLNLFHSKYSLIKLNL